MLAADRRSLDARAAALMVLLTMCWGSQQVAIKLALPAVAPLTQAALRSALAGALLLGWARWRGIALLGRDGTLAAGLAAGALFAAEFCLIYAGLVHTSASRMVVFVYLAPILTALGLGWLIPDERLSPLQWAGVALAFAGLAGAFADGVAAGSRSTLLGDLFGVIAAALLLPAAALLVGEPGVGRLDAIAAISLLFQGVVVAFASCLGWFWLPTRYLAARLAVFSFLAPLFGVLFGVSILGETLSASFAVAAVAMGAGIALVNLRRGR